MSEAERRERLRGEVMVLKARVVALRTTSSSPGFQDHLSEAMRTLEDVETFYVVNAEDQESRNFPWMDEAERHVRAVRQALADLEVSQRTAN